MNTGKTNLEKQVTAWVNKSQSSWLVGGKIPRDWLYKFISWIVLTVLSIILVNSRDQFGMTYESIASIVILFHAVFLWVSNLLPHGVTGLLIMVAVPMLNILPANQTLAAFGNQAVFFLIGVFLMVAAVIDSGLAKRFSLLMLKGNSKSIGIVYVKIFIGCLVMSWLMPEHAVAAIFFPVVLEISKLLGETGETRPMSMLLFVGMAWGAVVGGIGTLLGGARAAIAIEFMKDITHQAVSFWDYAEIGVPISIVLGFAVLFTFPLLIKGLNLKTPVDELSIQSLSNKLGKISFRETRVLVVFISIILLWMFGGSWISLSTAGMLGAVLMFLFRCISWNEADKIVNWNVILMYGGAIVLGYVLNHSYAGKIMIGFLPDSLLNNEIMLVLIFSVITITLTEFMSNAAALTIIFPIVLSAALDHHLNTMIIFYSITLISGLAFVFPMSSPPNAIAFSSGTYSIGNIFGKGLIISLIALIIVLSYLFILFG